MSRCGKSFRPSRPAQPTVSSKRELSSPLSPEDLPLKINKGPVAETGNTMDNEADVGSLPPENLGHIAGLIKPSLHSAILTSIRGDLKSIVKDAVSEVIDVKLRTLNPDNAILKTENKALKKRVKKLESPMGGAEQYSRRNCLRISNLAEKPNANTD